VGLYTLPLASLVWSFYLRFPSDENTKMVSFSDEHTKMGLFIVMFCIRSFLPSSVVCVNAFCELLSHLFVVDTTERRIHSTVMR
jgi:hypothetical protein